MNIMEVRNVEKVYGSKNGGSESNALNGVSFSVAKGEFLATSKLRVSEVPRGSL